MKIRRIRLMVQMLAVLASAVIQTLAASDGVEIVSDGKPLAVVRVHAGLMAEDAKLAKDTPYAKQRVEMDRRRLRDSVHDLIHYVKMMSGAELPLREGRAPSPAEERQLSIYVGDLAREVFGPPAKSYPYEQGWRLVVGEKGIGLIGESDLAASYALYEVLHRLGCRWYMPGDLGEEVPSRPTIELPVLDISAVPAILGRNIGPLDADFQRRNRCGGLQVNFDNISRNGLFKYLTREQLTEHPNWNALVNGKREITGIYCWSNPEVAVAVADSICARLDAAYTPSVSLSQQYAKEFCECSDCAKLDANAKCALMDSPSRSDRYVWFCSRVAERVVLKYPEVLFGMIANMDYIDPPVREKPHLSIVPAVVMSNSCRSHSLDEADCPSRQEMRRVISGWGELSPRVIAYEFAYNLAEVAAPYPQLRVAKDIPYLFAHRVCFWMPAGWVSDTMSTFASTLPGSYLGMRLAWTPKDDPEQVLKEFYTRFYGAASEPMRRYWQVMDDAWEKTPEHAGSHYGFYNRFPPQITTAARGALNDAIRAARTAMEYRRVKLAEDAFSDFELYMTLRRNLCEGRWRNLNDDAARWLGAYRCHVDEYRANAGFAPIARNFFELFCGRIYTEATHIARESILLSAPVSKWRYQVDRDRQGEAAGWFRTAFADQAWPQTDAHAQTWSDIGLFSYYGSMWYRAMVHVAPAQAGKKVFLWISGVDDTCQVYVNGEAVPYLNEKSERLPVVSAYAKPLTFDISAAVKPEGDNQITLHCTRSTLNEVGTGGLLGPIVIYAEK